MKASPAPDRLSIEGRGRYAAKQRVPPDAGGLRGADRGLRGGGVPAGSTGRVDHPGGNAGGPGRLLPPYRFAVSGDPPPVGVSGGRAERRAQAGYPGQPGGGALHPEKRSLQAHRHPPGAVRAAGPGQKPPVRRAGGYLPPAENAPDLYPGPVGASGGGRAGGGETPVVYPECERPAGPD